MKSLEAATHNLFFTGKGGVGGGPAFYPVLERYVITRIGEFGLIPLERKVQLESLAEYVRGQLATGRPAKLTFVCTHNSRRSQLSQVWAHVAADSYCLKDVETYSGGTEATAFNPRAVAAMQRSGLSVTMLDGDAPNPRYQVKAAAGSATQECFSKRFDAPPNPSSGYCAVMTCSQADQACPSVMGSDLRLAIRYDDPKIADDTDQESQRYDERSAQICREMLFMASRV